MWFLSIGHDEWPAMVLAHALSCLSVSQWVEARSLIKFSQKEKEEQQWVF